MKKFLVALLVLGFVVLLGIFVSFHTLSPSLEREWALDHSILPTADIEENIVTIENVRNFQYTEDGAVVEGYYTEQYDLDRLERVDLSLNTIPVIGGAHPFLIFSFSDGKEVAISVEARRERNETYSAFKGFFPQYELIYVIADEQDALGRRLFERETVTYVYPLKISEEGEKELFIHLLERANQLSDEPEFYNTLTHNCVNNLVRIANEIQPGSFPTFHVGTVFPKYSDSLLYNRGFINTDLTLAQAREHFAIDREAAINALGIRLGLFPLGLRAPRCLGVSLILASAPC